MSDIDEANEARHGFRIVDLERVVQRKGVEVDDCRCHACFGEDAQLRIDQISLGGDEQDAHLVGGPAGIENLEIELDRLHVREVRPEEPAGQLPESARIARRQLAMACRRGRDAPEPGAPGRR